MNALSYDTTNQAAFPGEGALSAAVLSMRPAESISRWRQLLDGLKAVHAVQISRISDAMLSNRPFSEDVVCNENFVVNVFLNSPDAGELKAVLTEKSREGLEAEETNVPWNDNPVNIEMLFAKMHAANDRIMNAKRELETLWQVRHEGLEEKLSEIKRSYVCWSLQIANLLFVNNLMGKKIVKDQFEETPLNEFKSSPLFNQFAASVPELTEAVELAGVHDRKLYDVADELNRLVMFSQWDKSYLLYREVFPPAINALCEHLEQVSSLEKSIVMAQARCINLFSERIAPASGTITDFLNCFSRMLREKSGNMALPHSDTSWT